MPTEPCVFYTSGKGNTPLAAGRGWSGREGCQGPGQSLAPRPGGRDWIQIHFWDQMRSPRSSLVTALFLHLPLLPLLLSPRDMILEQIYLLGTYGSVGVKQ